MWQSEAQGQISSLENEKGTGDKVSNFSLPMMGQSASGPSHRVSCSLVHTLSSSTGQRAAVQPDQGQDSLSCWQPAGEASEQKQEWGREKGSPWTRDLGASRVSRLPGTSSSGNSGIPAPFLPPSAFPCPTPGSSRRCDHTPLPQDFLRCVTAALIYFAISITAVAKYSDGASKAAGVSSCLTPGTGVPSDASQDTPT